MNIKKILNLIENPITQLAFGFFVIIFICYKCESISQSMNKNADQVTKEKVERVVSNAYDSAIQEMKLKLKSPSTAKFASPYEKGAKFKVNDDKTVIIESFVDAQNSLGVTVRQTFRCTVNQNGEVSDLIIW